MLKKHCLHLYKAKFKVFIVKKCIYMIHFQEKKLFSLFSEYNLCIIIIYVKIYKEKKICIFLEPNLEFS